ncbi:alpha/beta fold hydrolase [Streptomyces sp. PmtG]
MNRTPAPVRRPRVPRTPRRAVAAVAAPLALAVAALTAGSGPAAAAERGRYPVGGVVDGVANFLFSPNAVTGVNDWNCKPSAQHPNPVVLVHGTGVNLGANWVKTGPTLANEGHCVYAFNYGMGTAFDLGGRVGGLTGIAKSAQTMDAFVDKVLKATGAKKVNVLGHSQGGMMPNYYIKRLGGAKKVDRLVALAPTNHGTTLSGLVNLGEALGLLGVVNAAFDHLGLQGLKGPGGRVAVPEGPVRGRRHGAGRAVHGDRHESRRRRQSVSAGVPEGGERAERGRAGRVSEGFRGACGTVHGRADDGDGGERVGGGPGGLPAALRRLRPAVLTRGAPQAHPSPLRVRLPPFPRSKPFGAPRLVLKRRTG